MTLISSERLKTRHIYRSLEELINKVCVTPGFVNLLTTLITDNSPSHHRSIAFVTLVRLTPHALRHLANL
jgi:hypothetical protein